MIVRSMPANNPILMSLENEKLINFSSLIELYLKTTQETINDIANIPCSSKLDLSPKTWSPIEKNVNNRTAIEIPLKNHCSESLSFPLYLLNKENRKQTKATISIEEITANAIVANIGFFRPNEANNFINSV